MIHIDLLKKIEDSPVFRRCAVLLQAIPVSMLLTLCPGQAAAEQGWTTDLTSGVHDYTARKSPSPEPAAIRSPSDISRGRAGPNYAWGGGSGSLSGTSLISPPGAPDIVYRSSPAGGGSTPSTRPVYSQAALIEEGRRLAASPPRDFHNASDLACMAVAIYHEARSEPTLGQQAVATVVMRRAQVQRWRDDICGVISENAQFSFMTGPVQFPPITEMNSWYRSIAVAIRSLVDGPIPELAEADHYHATHVQPSWRNKMDVIARIGEHVFYRDPKTPFFE